MSTLENIIALVFAVLFLSTMYCVAYDLTDGRFTDED